MRRYMLAAVAAAVVVAPALAAAPAGAATGSARVVNWPTIRQGARGENVRTIQYLLNSRGFRVGVDGVYGSSTTSAVAAFQRSARVTADGRVGAATWPKLVVTLRRGSRSVAVTALERQLRFRYRYTRVVVDTDFGPLTDAAVRDVQRNHGLRVDGIVGGTTWKAIVVG